MSLRSKIIVTLLFFSIIPAVTIGLIGTGNSQKALGEQVGVRSLEYVQLCMQRINEYMHMKLEDVCGISLAVRGHNIGHDNHESHVSELLGELLETNDDFFNLMVLDPGGEVIASSSEELTGKDFSKEVGFRTALGSEIYIEDVSFDEIADDYAVVIFVPIKGSEEFDHEEERGHEDAENAGNFGSASVLRASLKWDQISTMISDLEVGGQEQCECDHLMLITKEGLAISGYDHTDMLKDNLLEIGMPSAIEATKRNEGFVREITEHGEESFSAYTYQKDYRDLPNLNWSLILVQSPDRVFASIKSLKRANVFTLLGFMLLATVASLVLSDAICRPILKTAETAQAINRGDLEKRVPVESNDEIGILSKSFNEMVEKFVRSNINFRESLEQRRRAEKILGNLNDELESTVSKLEEANQDMKDFVYIASHDLRQPLRAITSFGQLLERSIGGSLDEENKENLGFMIDGALRMNQMIEDLLVYSRVTTKEIKFEAIDLNEVVEQLEQIEVAAALSEADGTIEVPEALPTVKVNRGQISQLLQNFIANGLKYLAEGVKPSIVVTSEETGDGKVKIMVTDNGIGIDDKYKGEVFKMFRRLHSRSEYEGTGIGLAVCKKIVDRHNGQIGVESEVGKGSTFWFTVPVAMGEAKASVEAVGV